jgi:hypothetical protein
MLYVEQLVCKGISILKQVYDILHPCSIVLVPQAVQSLIYYGVLCFCFPGARHLAAALCGIQSSRLAVEGSCESIRFSKESLEVGVDEAVVQTFIEQFSRPKQFPMSRLNSAAFGSTYMLST